MNRRKFICETLKYIDDNFGDKMVLDELAETSGYSVPQFSRLFTEFTGITPMRYVNVVRIQNSTAMLSETNKSITEIAFACGFDTLEVFERSFKKYFGISASEYRSGCQHTPTPFYLSEQIYYERLRNIKYNYYKCTGVKRHKGCHKKTVRKADIEEIVLNDVMDKMFKEDLINDIADSVMRLQEKENTTIPLMQKQLAEIHQSINNLVKAMEMGIVSRETKQRCEELEAQRTELETDIIKQEIQEEIITREQVVEWLKEMKRLDLSLDDSKRKLVDTFVNSVYLYDDKVVIIFNCREGASTLALPLDDTSACMRIGEPVNS